MSLKHLNDETFADAITSGITLVDFWADWCGPCKMFGPIFEEAANKNSDINFAKFELDEKNRRTAAQYGIRSIPSVLAFKDGKLIEVRTGVMDIDTISDWIKDLKG